MGRGLRSYKPRTTVHTLINRLFGVSKPALVQSQGLLAREEFPDVSFYQGAINWLVMRSKAQKVIIRAGQNTWVDVKFVTNYAQAKQAGLARGVYWFFDGRASPGRQAALLVSLLRADLPELPVFIDWERNYGGAWEGLGNVVAMMQEVERLLPGVEVGMYTGYYFFRENSNPLLHASQYAYLAKKKLWLAFYAPLASVLIPAPWTKMTYWQFGTPPRGKELGTESIEIDMNEDMGGVPLPVPEPEKPMTKYKFTILTNERSATNATLPNLTGKVYQIGDVVDVAEIVTVSGNQWFKLENGYYAAYIYNGTVRAVEVPEPEPGEGVRVSADIDLTLDIGGKRYVATVSVEDVVMVEVA